MRIKHLKLLNFRNHLCLEIDFLDTNLLLGANGTGKTSILEAVFLLSTSKSPRTAKNSDLINFKKEKAFLEVVLVDKNKEEKIIRLELYRHKKNKNKIFSFDGLVVEPKEVVGFFKTVYFSPETLEIITGSPTERRRFMDILLSQIDLSYLLDLIEYKKILVNRNKLLKEIALHRCQRDEIIFWDRKLIEIGSRIMQTRKEMLEKLSQPLSFFYQAVMDRKNNEPVPAAGGISGQVRWRGGSAAASIPGSHYRQRRDLRTSPNKLGICYHPSFVIDQEEDIEAAFARRIATEIDFELKCGNTLYGPHRDDIHFYYNKREAASFCSRGEVRSIVVALKLAEADYIRNQTDDEPVILLDDIFSELDRKRTQALSKLVLGNFQSIITSTGKDLTKIFKNNQYKLIHLVKKKAKKKIYV